VKALHKSRVRSSVVSEQSDEDECEQGARRCLHPWMAKHAGSPARGSPSKSMDAHTINRSGAYPIPDGSLVCFRDYYGQTLVVQPYGKHYILTPTANSSGCIALGKGL
jgi:hypothetical protein